MRLPIYGATCAIAVVLALAAAGCGSSNSTSQEGTTASPSYDTSSSSPSDTTTPDGGGAAAPTSAKVEQYSFDYVEDSGVKLTFDVTFSAVMRAADSIAEATWQSISPEAPSSLPCVTNPTTDGVIVGSYTVHNDTPSYSPMATGLDVNHADGVEVCTADDNQQANADFTLEWSALETPQPLVLVLPNLYGPSGADESTYADEAFFGFRDLVRGSRLEAGQNTELDQYDILMNLPAEVMPAGS